MTATDETERTAGSTGQGRKSLCKETMTNGKTCQLWKGHADLDPSDPNFSADHNALEFTAEELSAEFMSDEEVSATIITTAAPDPMELRVREDLAKNYAEWVRRGSNKDKPVWSRVFVDPPKVHRVKTWLRKAADETEPKAIQVRISDTFVAGGKVQVAFAGLPRRQYDRSAKK